MTGAETPDRPPFTVGAAGERLRQPDRRSCGATVLVVARMLLDPAYAEFLAAGRFRDEVLGMHRRVTGVVDVSGRLQLPWSRALGTPPWAVARQLSATGGVELAPVRYSSRPLWGDLDRRFDQLLAVTAIGRPVPMYVGSRWSPRHVVLAIGVVDGRLRCYEPSRGRLVDVDRVTFTTARLDLAGWDRPWFVVLPA